MLRVLTPYKKRPLEQLILKISHCYIVEQLRSGEVVCRSRVVDGIHRVLIFASTLRDNRRQEWIIGLILFIIG
jgi:hypothetical protein